MTPNVVVDIGNTRIKWGAVGPSGDVVCTASLPDDPAAWHSQFTEWAESGVLPTGRLAWALASVQPEQCARLSEWLESGGNHVAQIRRAADLPLTVGLPEPDKVGIDRLLNAVAAKRTLPPGRGAVLIDAGSAVTIDWLDEDHLFRGGLIAPGLDLMAKALNGYTALLPRVEITLPIPTLPADRTVTAMQAGIFLSVSGCIREGVRIYSAQAKVPPRVFFTGGQAPLLARGMRLDDPSPPWHDWLLWPEQTLAGILYAAESLP